MCSHNRVMSMKIRQDKNSYEEIKKTSTYSVYLLSSQLIDTTYPLFNTKSKIVL